MARLLVGDPECTIQELTSLMDESSIAATLITEWTSLARRLGTPLHTIDKYRQDLLLRILTQCDVVEKLFVEWTSRMGKEATLGNLYQKIPNSLKLLRDMLQDKIRENAKCWKDLDEDSQKVVMRTNVNFLGRKYSVSSIRDMVNEDKFDEILNKIELKEFFLRSFKNEDWDLGHYEIPKSLPFYIHRKLTLKRRLNPAIFKHKCTDIFVFEGLKHHHLSILGRPELTDISSEQLHIVNRRFILLEHPDDYDVITKIAKYPVHRIKHEDNQFYWISTSGSCKLIRVFLMSDVEEFDQTTFVKDHLSTFNNRPIAICSSPGMGKSAFLANLERELRYIYPKRITIYIELRSLIPKLSSIRPEVKLENIYHILISSPSISLIGQEILLELLQRSELEFEVFLDGFDEISFEYLQIAKQFLKYIMNCPKIRTYITSRPHMQSEIENILEVISLDIAPFNLENQVNFLCDFWALDGSIKKNRKLSEFASTVLKSLEFINDNMPLETKFAGIPLQCFMLAQVYTNQAKMYCNRDNFNFQATKSLNDLYTTFIRFKFKNIAKCDRTLIKIHHWKEALMLLFPNNQQATKILQKLTCKIGPEATPWEKIFAVGVMEYASEEPSFVHRTFAEYLLAEFIVEDILLNEFVDINTWNSFIIDSVVFVYKTTKGHILSKTEIEDVCRIIYSSESRFFGKLDLKNLKAMLLSECHVSLDVFGDNLYSILGNFIIKMGINATTDKFDRALDFLGCSELKDDLHKNVFREKRVLQHEMLCTFAEGMLQKYDTLFSTKKFTYCVSDNVSLTYDWDQFYIKLLACTKHGYQLLTQLLVRISCETSLFNNVVHISDEICMELVLAASRNDNVEFFKYICDMVKPKMKLNLDNFIRTFRQKDRLFAMTPFFVSISNGNYKLVEYLLNCLGDDAKQNNNLWVACFVDRYKDSRIVVQNKVKLLMLLRNVNQKFQVEQLEQQFHSGVNLVLLTTLYDLCEYVPGEKDVPFISKSIAFCCRHDAEFANLVKWLLSKNRAYLLTNRHVSSYCLFSVALQMNVANPETLSMVYREFQFELGIIYREAVVCKRNEAIVKTIVALSGDVNLRDESKSTLLHWAAWDRKINLVNYLLSISANVNLKNAYGNTPLYNVFQSNGYLENFHFVHDIVCLFLANKADVCAKNIAGLSALDLAKANQDEMSIEEKTILLLENAVHQSMDKYISFKSSKPEFKICDDHVWQQIVFDAIQCKRFLAFVQNVLHISGNANISGPRKTTLLHFAALVGEEEAMQYLLFNEANANLKNDDGNTALHYIFYWSLRKRDKVLISLNTNTQWIHSCVQLLLKYNADVNFKNNKGKTPLDLAQQREVKLIVEDRTITLLVQRSHNQMLRKKLRQRLQRQ